MGRGVEGPAPLVRELTSFNEFGAQTRVTETLSSDETLSAPTYVNEFWTAKQRAAHPLHEISYRACFKPQLPRFFITRLTGPDELVYDPFLGRGTTALEAALLGRAPAGCDVNPLSEILTRPRLAPPTLKEIETRLGEIDLSTERDTPGELLVFYHADTLRELCSLREYLLEQEKAGKTDAVDGWLRMTALNRLTGHSAGFLSVYTLPPNQAVSLASQRRINRRRGQSPGYRDLRALLLKKSRSLLRGGGMTAARTALLITGDAAHTPELADNCVSLVVTSPPFLDTVDYRADNWLRLWFLGVDPSSLPLSQLSRLDEWEAKMEAVFRELARVLLPGGRVAFEVGEVRAGALELERNVLSAGARAGLQAELVLVNRQQFTKTANCWGVDNGLKGTNSNRVVLFRKA